MCESEHGESCLQHSCEVHHLLVAAMWFRTDCIVLQQARDDCVVAASGDGTISITDLRTLKVDTLAHNQMACHENIGHLPAQLSFTTAKACLE